MPQVYISTNDFLFRSNPLFPYIFFSILALEIIAGLCISLYFVQLKKREGVVGVQYFNIKKQYLYAAIGMCIPAVGLAIFLLIRFFAIFPIGDNLQSIPSIVLFMLLVTGLGLTGVALFYSFKDLNTSIFCPVGSHYDPETLQCYAGCNGDDSNCNPGEVCLGNQCCPNDQICGTSGACCPAAECQTDPSDPSKKFCCPAESVCTTKAGIVNCCSTGTVCDKESGACVATCGSSLKCKPGQYCFSFPEVSAEAVDGIFCPFPESKAYDAETSTLYCCFGNPTDKDCAAQDTPQRVPGETGNYTACFSNLDVDPNDIKALYEAKDDAAFNEAGTKIMSQGKNMNKKGYMCGFDGPLIRGYQSIYSSETGTCQDKQGLCNNDATTRTTQMMGALSDDGKTLYCTQTIACNTQKTGNTTDGLASGYPSKYASTNVVCNKTNLCTISEEQEISFKNPDDLTPKSPSVGTSPSSSSSASYVFQPDCTNYPEITSKELQDCKGTLMDGSPTLKCAAEDTYKYIEAPEIPKTYCQIENHNLVCKPLAAGKDPSQYTECINDCETQINLVAANNQALVLDSGNCSRFRDGGFFDNGEPTDCCGSQWGLGSGMRCDMQAIIGKYWGTDNGQYCPKGTKPYFSFTKPINQRFESGLKVCNNEHDGQFSEAQITCCDPTIAKLHGRPLSAETNYAPPNGEEGCYQEVFPIQWKYYDEDGNSANVLLGRVGSGHSDCGTGRNGCDNDSSACAQHWKDTFQGYNDGNFLQ